MPFDEALKLKVKRQAHFRCCLCREIYVEVHHIVPEHDGGLSVEDNAAPLCPSCHEKYGENPTKRKFIRETRDFWYDLCAQHPADLALMQSIDAKLRDLPTKSDLARAFDALMSAVKEKVDAPTTSVADARDLVAHVTLSVATSPRVMPSGLVAYTLLGAPKVNINSDRTEAAPEKDPPTA